MAKIMLVEDDNNLREIYEARLAADGYEIIAAQDGEEALAMAVKEKPDLIISDIMMPKISGFDMLDILRSTPETKDTKVIMMTALSQAEDKARAAQMGADRYLVKSQVTLEDVAKVAREVLEGDNLTAIAEPAPAGFTPPSVTTPTTQAGPIAIQIPPSEPPVPPAPTPEPPATPPAADTPAAPPSAGNSMPSQAAAVIAHTRPIDPNLGQSTKSETETVEAQISDFVQHATPEPNTPVTPQSAPSIGINADGEITIGASEESLTPPDPPAHNPEPVPTRSQPAPAPPPISQPPQPVAPPPPAASVVPNVTAPSRPIPVVASPQHPEVKTSVQPVHQKVIQPINDISKSSVDLQALLAKEETVASGQVQPSEATGPEVAAIVSPDIIAEKAAEEAAKAATSNTESTPAMPLPGTTFDPNSVAL